MTAFTLSLLAAEGAAPPAPPAAVENGSPSAPVEAAGPNPMGASAAAADTLVDDLAAEDANPEGNTLDPLEYTQKELQTRFQGGLALNLGPVSPWADVGASILWKKWDVIQSVSLGAGNFEYSDNYRQRNYMVKTESQSVYYAARWFVLGFGPIYLEPFLGLVRWNGDIKPRGFDDVSDTLSSSLNSRFDITGVSAGGNLGLMWIFTNGLFLDYNLVGLNASAFVQSNFTVNSGEAKKNVRRQLGGPLTMSNAHIRIGWSLEI